MLRKLLLRLEHRNEKRKGVQFGVTVDTPKSVLYNSGWLHIQEDINAKAQYLYYVCRSITDYRISPSISREISDNFENANLGVRPILGSRKMSSLTTRQATNMFANESSFVAADKFSEQ